MLPTRRKTGFWKSWSVRNMKMSAQETRSDPKAKKPRLLDNDKAPYTLWVELGDFTVWLHTWRKNWVNCAVLIGNSAGLRTVLSSCLSHTELRSSPRESRSFLSLPADTTMASSQATPTNDKPDGKPVLCQRIFRSVFLAVFYTAKLHSLT
jgi:hypothetical protein